MCCIVAKHAGQSPTFSGAPNGTVLHNIYSLDIVSWMAKYAEQIINLYKC